MKKNFQTSHLILLIIVLLLISSEIFLWKFGQKKNLVPTSTGPISTTTKVMVLPSTIIYAVSSEDPVKYCNGVDMDSVGYEKTITIKKVTSTPEVNPTKIQIIKAMINAATTGNCREALGKLPITENNGVVSMPPIDGWAGVSIAMCACKPQVEVNLLQINGITKVEWK